MTRDGATEKRNVVLCVGDDDDVVQLMQRVFRDDGHDVEQASHPTSALERVNRGGVDAVILALDPRRSSAMEFLRQVNRLPASPPVVYVTASADLEVAFEALKAGAASFVVRTFGSDFDVQLLAALQQSFAQAEAYREKDRTTNEVREQRDRAVALLDEVNHRVANSLALVVSLVRMQAAATPDASAKSVLAEIQARIAAVANLHRTLYASETEDVLAVDLATYLKALVEELRQSIATESKTVVLSAPAVAARLNTERAVAIGIIATELITNAIKYAYPGGDGEVRLLLQREPEGGVILAIEDDGVGFAGGLDKNVGLGGRIVYAMAHSLDSRLEYQTPTRGARAVLRLNPELFIDLQPLRRA
jgi:two-component sensor histidine kinase